MLCVEVLVVTWRPFFKDSGRCLILLKYRFFTMSVNYDRVCRLCLSTRGELLPIFPTTSSDDSEPHVLASKIKDCVSVEVCNINNMVYSEVLSESRPSHT